MDFQQGFYLVVTWRADLLILDRSGESGDG